MPMISRFGLLDSISGDPGPRKEVEALMRIRRLLGAVVALLLLYSASPLVAQQRGTTGQPAPQTPRPPDPDTVALVQMVDAAIVKAPAAQAEDTRQGDIVLNWEAAHFIKGQNGVYVPFTLTFDPASVRTSEVALYIRAVQ